MLESESKIQIMPFYDAFISYSHSDEKFAEKLVTDLVANKFDIFLDKWHISYGQNIANSIKTALNRSSKIIAIISEKYLLSDWATYERNYYWSDIYLNHRDKMIPIIKERCKLPREISQLLYINFTKGKYDDKLRELKKAIKNINRLKIGPYQLIKENVFEEIHIEHICKKINFYFKDHRLNVLKFAYNELIRNAFEHTISLRVYLTVTSTSYDINVEVQDSGKGFDIIKAINEKREELENNPLINKGRGLLMLLNECDYIENVKSKSSHTVSVVINKEKRTNQANSFSQYQSSKAEVVTYISNDDKALFICINSRKLNVHNAHYLRMALYQIINPKFKWHILELRNAEFVDSSGFAAILDFYNIIKNVVGEDCNIAIVCNDTILELFELLRLDKVFPIYLNLETVINQFKS